MLVYILVKRNQLVLTKFTFSFRKYEYKMHRFQQMQQSFTILMTNFIVLDNYFLFFFSTNVATLEFKHSGFFSSKSIQPCSLSDISLKETISRLQCKLQHGDFLISKSNGFVITYCSMRKMSSFSQRPAPKLIQLIRFFSDDSYHVLIFPI